MATEHARHLKACVLLLALAGSLWFTGCAADKKKDGGSDGNDGNNGGGPAVKYKAEGTLPFWVHEDTYNDLQAADQTALEAAMKASFDAAFPPAKFTVKVKTLGFTTPFASPTVPPDYTPTPTAVADKYIPAPCKSKWEIDGSRCSIALLALYGFDIGCRGNTNYRRYITSESSCIDSTPAPTPVEQFVSPAPTPLPGQPGGIPTPSPTVIADLVSAAPTTHPTPHPTTPFPTPSACEHSTGTGTFKPLEFYFTVEGPEAKPKLVTKSNGEKKYEYPGLSPSGWDDGDDEWIDITQWNAKFLNTFFQFPSYSGGVSLSSSDSETRKYVDQWKKVLAPDHSEPQMRMVPHLADALSDLKNRTNSSDFLCTPSASMWDDTTTAPTTPISQDLFLRINEITFGGSHEMCDTFAVMSKGCIYSR